MPDPDAEERPPHLSVLYHESINFLQPKNHGRYVDGTLGAGGHAAGILDSSQPDGQLLGLDIDDQALQIAESQVSRVWQQSHYKKRFLCQFSRTPSHYQLGMRRRDPPRPGAFLNAAGYIRTGAFLL